MKDVQVHFDNNKISTELQHFGNISNFDDSNDLLNAEIGSTETIVWQEQSFNCFLW